jgi:hypothetical protein
MVTDRLEVIFKSAIIEVDYVHLKMTLFEQIFTAKLALFCSMLNLKEALQR